MINIRRLHPILIALLFLSVLLTACDTGGGGDVVLPTRFIPPTEDTVTAVVPATLTAVVSATVPAVVSATITAGVPIDTPSPNIPTLLPSDTFTPPPTALPTLTFTPSMTITDTPTYTATTAPSPTQEMSSLLELARLAAQATIAPTVPVPTLPPLAPPTIAPFAATPTYAAAIATPLPATQCQFLPSGGFGSIIINEPNLVNTMGCPVGSPPVTASYASAVQMFQGGIMVWVGEMPGTIYAFYNDGTYHRFDDLFDPAVDAESGGETPPAGLLEPVRGFGKVWRSFESVRNTLGWAVSMEMGTDAVLQDFTFGRMLSISSRGEILILLYQQANTAAGTWRTVPGGF